MPASNIADNAVVISSLCSLVAFTDFEGSAAAKVFRSANVVSFVMRLACNAESKSVDSLVS